VRRWATRERLERAAQNRLWMCRPDILRVAGAESSDEDRRISIDGIFQVS